VNRFLNHKGWVVTESTGPRSWFGFKDYWEWTLAPRPFTLMWEGAIGGIAGFWQTDRHMACMDFGSVPLLLQAIPGLRNVRFRKSYGFHDSGCTYGGLWHCNGAGITLDGEDQDGHPLARIDADAEFTFVDLPRSALDCALAQMVTAEDAWRIQRWAVYRGVRIGAACGIGGGTR
jgi:hypothetical protein